MGEDIYCLCSLAFSTPQWVMQRYLMRQFQDTHAKRVLNAISSQRTEGGSIIMILRHVMEVFTASLFGQETKTCVPLSAGSEASFVDEWLEHDPLLHGDLQSLMQVGPPQLDLISHYALADAALHAKIAVCTWFHPNEALGQPAQISQLVYYNRGLPGGPFFRSIWDNTIGWETCRVVPVKPKPLENGGLSPHVLVTALQGEDMLPCYVSTRRIGKDGLGPWSYKLRDGLQCSNYSL